MWNRRDLKEKAKKALKGTYANGVVVSFLMLLASGDWLGKRSGGNANVNMEYTGNDFSQVMEGPKSIVETIGVSTVIGLVLGFITIALSIALIKILVGYLIEVGGRKYFLKASEGDSQVNYVTYGFKAGHWFNLVKTMFLRSLFTFLWTLLLVIPGMIKHYSYRMVPYLLAENPELDSLDAINMSKEMTAGRKMDMFILDLSFILWFLLGIFTFGIGFIFIMPYYNATYAEVYYTLKGSTSHEIYEG